MSTFFSKFFTTARVKMHTIWSNEDIKENLRFIRSGVQWVFICYSIDKYIFHLSMTYGPSMMPTINEMGDILLVEKLSPRFSWWNPLQRDDIIVADSHYKKNFSICKRIIGLPGDKITPPYWNYSITIPSDHIWIEGDNPFDSEDSRSYGPIPIHLVKGRVVAKIWPFWEIKWLINSNKDTDKNTSSTPIPIVQLPASSSEEHNNINIEQTNSTAIALPSLSNRPTANTLYRNLMKQDNVIKEWIINDLHQQKLLILQRKQAKLESKRLQQIALDTFLQALDKSSSESIDTTVTNKNPDNDVPSSSSVVESFDTISSHILNPDIEQYHEDALDNALSYPVSSYEITSTLGKHESFTSSSSSSLQ